MNEKLMNSVNICERFVVPYILIVSRTMPSYTSGGDHLAALKHGSSAGNTDPANICCT